MYYFLKHDTFFLPTERNGIFFRNNYNNIKVNVKESYLLFQKILPTLDGETNLAGILSQIQDVHIHAFYVKLFQSLYEKGFLIKSDSPIYFDKLDELTQIASYYSNKIDNTLKDAYEKNRICVKSANDAIRNVAIDSLERNHFNIVTNLDKKFSNKCENIVILTNNDDINTFNSLIANKMDSYVIYSDKNKSHTELIIKEANEYMDLTNENFILGPFISSQTISYLMAVIELEIIWKWGNLKEPRISHNSYVFDVGKDAGEFV